MGLISLFEWDRRALSPTQACVEQLDERWSSSTYTRRLSVWKRNTALAAVLTLQLIEKPSQLPLSPCTRPACSLLPGFNSPSVNNGITHHRRHCTCALYDAAAASPTTTRCKILRANVCWGRLVARFCLTAHVWTYRLLHREILMLFRHVKSASVWAWFRHQVQSKELNSFQAMQVFNYMNLYIIGTLDVLPELKKDSYTLVGKGKLLPLTEAGKQNGTGGKTSYCWATMGARM